MERRCQRSKLRSGDLCQRQTLQGLNESRMEKNALYFPCPQGTEDNSVTLFDQMNNFVPLYNDVKTGF